MKCKLNISIDDVSPHPDSSINVLDRCFELIEQFPYIKFTIFIPCAYSRFFKFPTECPLKLTEHPDFCKEIKRLPKNNFEIGYHGYYHGIKNVSDNDELSTLNYDSAINLYKKMQSEVTEAGLDKVFKNILRPPAWRMSAEAIKAAKNFGFSVLALSPDDYVNYEGQDKSFKNVVYYNCCPPFKPLCLHKNTEIVYHACEWDKNYLSKEFTNNLSEFIKANLTKIDFSFMESMI